MSLFEFLSTATVEQTSHRRSSSTKADSNPPENWLAIRVHADGSVYPSKALVEAFQLEYHKMNITKGKEVAHTEAAIKKHEEANAARIAAGKEAKELKPRFTPATYEPVDGVWGNGFDVIDSRHWAAYKGQKHMLFITPTPKSEPKVDLFATTKYNEDGTPVKSVLDQGSSTYGEEFLIPAIKDLYNIDLTTDRDYVDMIVFNTYQVGDQVINLNQQFATKVTHLPKVISRGDKAGSADYQRRERAVIYGFAPAEVLGISEAPAETAQEALQEETV